ncbi:MAG TPA: M67 family metallopeptidase [Pyrinomonadaceae bacterium]|nr:M67 family metallopeptidase [Pyrinomonadaceae bacterium]
MVAILDKCIDEIRRHGASDYPYECCGLLLGSFEPGGSKAVTETYAISNAREEEAKRNRFLITPEELLRGERYARDKNLEVVGFYHSHPDSPAVPSQYDLEHAWPVYSYIIVNTGNDKTGDLRSWIQRADRSQFDEEPVEVMLCNLSS